MDYLDLSVFQPPAVRHPMEAFLVEDERMDRAELVTWHIENEADVEYALFRVAGDVDAYRERIADVASIPEYTVSPIDDGQFYSYVCQVTREVDREFRRAFVRRNLVVVPPIEYPGDGTMRVTVVGESDDLRALVEDMPEWADADVERVGEFDRRRGRVAGELTARQREAVAAAVERGYYDVPRSATLDDVAADLDCSPGTASVLLRRAERAVMSAIAGDAEE